MTRIFVITLTLFLFSSCDKRTDLQTWTDGKIEIESFTIVPSEIQSSSPNVSFITATFEGTTKEIMKYDTYGVNNVDIKFMDQTIVINGRDAQTAGLLIHSRPVDSINGYKILVDTTETWN